MQDITHSAITGQQAKAEFQLRMRARGISDIDVLRALETVPRELFVPHRYIDLANRDIALPIGCGQTMPEPLMVARMMEALQLEPQLRVLEVGAGSGYTTAVLARLCGHVVAIERFQSLAIAAAGRLQRLHVSNAEVVWMDALALTPEIGKFDRILVHATLEGVPNIFLTLLARGGRLLAGRSLPVETGSHIQRLVQMSINTLGLPVEQDLGPCRMRPLIRGRSQDL
ncbi:MAG: methyltransferase domain-containing protein [Hyphomicrobiales bacterium]|nr:methyltransferase domain-containing protein [Hyphomicrobiales bacterium]MDE2113938.1 methyltransferase domain-containing protein [Hyphomicrobiales bacterium]